MIVPKVGVLTLVQLVSLLSFTQVRIVSKSFQDCFERIVLSLKQQSSFVMLLSELKVTCNETLMLCKSWVTYMKNDDTSTYLINIEGDIITPGLNFMTVSFQESPFNGQRFVSAFVCRST